MLKFNKKEFLLAEFEKGAVLFSLNNNVPYVVNKTGLSVLKLCNGTRDRRMLIKIMSEKYGVEQHKIREDLNYIIKKYKKTKILKSR
jgi:hypothetical protein